MSQQTNRTEQEIRRETSIFLLNTAKVSRERLGKGEAQYLIDDRHGSDRLGSCLYTIRRGGHTPLHQHQYEHHVYLLKEDSLLRGSKDADSLLNTLKPRETILIPSNAVRQFNNVRDEPFIFLYGKGNPHF